MSTTSPLPGVHPNAIRTFCLTSGLIMGGLWAMQAGSPVWEHALRFGILLFIVAPLGLRALNRRAGGVRLNGARLIGAKAVLLGAALAASAALQPLTDQADYLVAAGIAVVVALAGPLLVPVFLSRRPAS